MHDGRMARWRLDLGCGRRDRLLRVVDALATALPKADELLLTVMKTGSGDGEREGLDLRLDGLDVQANCQMHTDWH